MCLCHQQIDWEVCVPVLSSISQKVHSILVHPHPTFSWHCNREVPVPVLSITNQLESTFYVPHFTGGKVQVPLLPIIYQQESTCISHISLMGRRMSPSHQLLIHWKVHAWWEVRVPFPHQSPIKYMHALYFIDRETHVTVSPAGLLESTCMPQNQADGEVHVPVSPINWKVHAHPIVHWWWEMHVPVSPVIYLLESSCMPQTKWAAGSTCPGPTR